MTHFNFPTLALARHGYSYGLITCGGSRWPCRFFAQGAVRSAASNSNEVYAVPHFPNFRLMWKVCGLPAVSQATFTRTPLCTRFNRSPIARAFGLTRICIQGLVMLLFYTARLPSSFGSFGANNPTRTDNRLITNQLRYHLRHTSTRLLLNESGSHWLLEAYTSL